MKKYILFVLAVFFIGCKPQDTHTEKYIKINGSYDDLIIRKFEFENHQYIYAGFINRGTMEHDPNCPCFRVDK